MKKEEIKHQINDYKRRCKPKYFKRQEINELIQLLENVNEYINELEKTIYEQKEENTLLNSKLDAIKYNSITKIDLIETENNKLKDKLIYLNILVNNKNIIIRTFFKIFLYIMYVLFYSFNKYLQ